MTDKVVETHWAPQPGPQKILMDCPYPLIGFGGARGGGKTDAVLGKFGYRASIFGPGYNAVFFRREMPQADDLIERAKEIYLPCGFDWYEQKRLFMSPCGGRIRFRPLENDADSQKYQGQNLTDAAIEEAGNYPDPGPIWKLFGALRSSKGIPTQMILTFNPGGVGHNWIRERFIKPAPKGLKALNWTLPTGKVVKYIYIPSRVTDNRLLLLRDPGYVDRLHLVGSPELVRAWLEGDFEIRESAYFAQFGDKHIYSPIKIPKHWPKYVGFDWGHHSPFCAVWGAVSSGKDDTGAEVAYPKGAILIYRELWGKKIDNVEIGQRIAELTRDEDPVMVADPSIFNHHGGPSIADQLRDVLMSRGVPGFRPADNDRLSGWAQIRQRLVATPPMLYISSDCPYLLETLAALPNDPKNLEDVDTTAEDHAADALRYLCKERLLDSILDVKPIEPVQGGKVLINAYIDAMRRERNRAKF